MLGQNQRRRAVVKPTSGRRFVFTGLYRPAAQSLTLKLESNSPPIGVSGWGNDVCAKPGIYECCFDSSREQTFPCNVRQHWELFPVSCLVINVISIHK